MLTDEERKAERLEEERNLAEEEALFKHAALIAKANELGLGIRIAHHPSPGKGFLVYDLDEGEDDVEFFVVVVTGVSGITYRTNVLSESEVEQVLEEREEYLEAMES